jgi:hypothetical protein
MGTWTHTAHVMHGCMVHGACCMVHGACGAWVKVVQGLHVFVLHVQAANPPPG